MFVRFTFDVILNFGRSKVSRLLENKDFSQAVLIKKLGYQADFVSFGVLVLFFLLRLLLFLFINFVVVV